MARVRTRSAPARKLKFFTAILALPLCVGTAHALWRVFLLTGGAESFWVPFLAGAGCWFAIYALLPRPIWIYVCGHEFTHVLWAWIFGGQVKSMRISSKGGHVVLTKTNFLISLAPYFFPVYAIVILVAFITAHAIWGLNPWFPLLYLLLGTAYCFHLTLTCHALMTKQTDITDHGFLFSAVVIWLGNLATLICGLLLLTAKVSFLDAWMWIFSDTGSVVHWITDYVRL